MSTAYTDEQMIQFNNELAADLQKCAILVKRNERNDPLLRTTLERLTYFTTGREIRSVSRNTITNSPAQNGTTTVSTHHHNPLMGVLKKVGINLNDELSTSEASNRQATSSKNAARARADIEQHRAANSVRSKTKPAFQRPTNPKSALIANGWIEQQRRSKMRTVWKDVLASLVEAKKPGEETTLWIQREVINGTTGKKELEALHQIPVKWIQGVSYRNYSTDHRFVLKVYDLTEEFIFRCEDDPEAAQNWVLTLQSMQEIVRKQTGQKAPATTALDKEWDETGWRQSFEEEKKSEPRDPASHRVPPPRRQHSPVLSSYSVSPTPPTPAAAVTNHSHPPPPNHSHPPPPPQQTQTPPPPRPIAPPPPPQNPPEDQVPADEGARMTIKELRAIAHGFGITTVGMERSDLERIVREIATANAAPAPPSKSPPPQRPEVEDTSKREITEEDEAAAAAARRKEKDEERIRMQAEAAMRQKLAEESARRRTEAEAKQRDEEEKRMAAEKQRQVDEERRKADAEKQRHQQQEDERRRIEIEKQRIEIEKQKKMEEERRRLETEKQRQQEEERKRLEAERLRREEEEHRRRVAEMQAAEQRRRQEEQQRQQQQAWQQQQQAWQQQQAEEMRRRQAEEQRAAEERRRQEEAYRMQQQQQQQQWPNRPPGAPPHHGPGAPPPQHWHHPQQHMPHPPPPQNFAHHQQPPSGHHPGHHPHHHVPQPPSGASPVDMKYVNILAQTNDNGQMTTQTIKHGILVEWALQPPAMKSLKPIEILLTTVHTVFPPRYGVPGHSHFGKWSVVSLADIMSGAQPDAEKLKKAVRKFRFFLHPDKLPRDFSDEQQFMCKMLWDITSDAYEDHKKREEDLGWMRA